MINIGLYTGTTGQLLVHLLMQKYDHMNNRAKISNCIEKISNNIHLINDLSFENGITGLGWALEWCTQHDLLNINSDEILADIDDLLYRNTVYSSEYTVSFNELIGYANYFYRRALSHNKGQNRLRHICHRECLLLLLEDVARKRKISMEEECLDRSAYMRFLSTYFLLLSKVLMISDKTLDTEFNDISDLIQNEILKAIKDINIMNRIDMPLLYATAKLHELFLIVAKRTRQEYWYVQERAYTSEIESIISMQTTNNRNTLDELILCALHYLHTANKSTFLKLSDLQKSVSSMQLSNALCRGKGIVKVVHILKTVSPKNIDIEDLLLL